MFLPVAVAKVSQTESAREIGVGRTDLTLFSFVSPVVVVIEKVSAFVFGGRHDFVREKKKMGKFL